MHQTHVDLLRELTGVAAIFAQLGERLTTVASDLRGSGVPPSQNLLREIAESRSNFDGLRQRAVELASLLSPSAPIRAEDIASLKDLKALLQSLREAEEKKSADEKITGQALMTLDRILSLTHRDGQPFHPLITCQAKARELREAIATSSWPNTHPEAVALAHRRHPLTELLTLVEEHDKLDDDLWLVLKHAVSESFGKAVSLAAARGKLVLSEPVPFQDSRRIDGLAGQAVSLPLVSPEKLAANDRTPARVPDEPVRSAPQEA